MKIHHTGIVVRSIDEHLRKYFSHFLPIRRNDPIIHDPLQRVNALFIELPGGRIELVEPAGDDSPVSAILQNNQAVLHHVCLEVEDLDATLDLYRSRGMLVVSPPQPGIAFGGRRIAFVMGRDRLLWELLEQ